MLLPGRHCWLLHLKGSSFLESTVERAFYKLNASEVGKASTTFCICATTIGSLVKFCFIFNSYEP